jgi:hypothetical protein
MRGLYVLMGKYSEAQRSSVPIAMKKYPYVVHDVIVDSRGVRCRCWCAMCVCVFFLGGDSCMNRWLGELIQESQVRNYVCTYFYICTDACLH